MNKYVPGVIISSIFLLFLVVLDRKVYSGVMSINLLILLLSLHVFVYAHLMQRHKHRLRYAVFVCLFVVCTVLSLPKVTQKEAEEITLANHPMHIVVNRTVPLKRDWNPFTPSRAYVFEGTTKGNQSISVLVSPNSGDIHILE